MFCLTYVAESPRELFCPKIHWTHFFCQFGCQIYLPAFIDLILCFSVIDRTFPSGKSMKKD